MTCMLVWAVLEPPSRLARVWVEEWPRLACEGICSYLYCIQVAPRTVLQGKIILILNNCLTILFNVLATEPMEGSQFRPEAGFPQSSRIPQLT